MKGRYVIVRIGSNDRMVLSDDKSNYYWPNYESGIMYDTTILEDNLIDSDECEFIRGCTSFDF